MHIQLNPKSPVNKTISYNLPPTSRSKNEKNDINYEEEELLFLKRNLDKPKLRDYESEKLERHFNIRHLQKIKEFNTIKAKKLSTQKISNNKILPIVTDSIKQLHQLNKNKKIKNEHTKYFKTETNKNMMNKHNFFNFMNYDSLYKQLDYFHTLDVPSKVEILKKELKPCDKKVYKKIYEKPELSKNLCTDFFNKARSVNKNFKHSSVIFPLVKREDSTKASNFKYILENILSK